MVISILNHKGGVGKTTTAVNLGAAMALKGKKVLLVDLDSQANLTSNLGFEPSDENIYTALRGDCALPIKNYSKNIDVVCSHIDLAAADMEFVTAVRREYKLHDLLKDSFDKYDTIILDCAPSLGFTTLNALTISNYVIIPIELSFFALSGMAKLINLITLFQEKVNDSLKEYYILATRTDFRKTAHKDIFNEIEKVYGNHVLQTYIRSNVKLEESQINKKDIYSYEKNCFGAEDYFLLSDEINLIIKK